jgi:hypothetical protein
MVKLFSKSEGALIKGFEKGVILTAPKPALCRRDEKDIGILVKRRKVCSYLEYGKSL